ncbi:uncharacterized protein LOC142687191 [Rhinoderma darwinii]|uniref:uncharacterized protein LOC142652385 n=1 Tax=Rhinoderma darwinii TaxID=43563 RepID=UPI003F66F077
MEEERDGEEQSYPQLFSCLQRVTPHNMKIPLRSSELISTAVAADDESEERLQREGRQFSDHLINPVITDVPDFKERLSGELVFLKTSQIVHGIFSELIKKEKIGQKREKIIEFRRAPLITVLAVISRQQDSFLAEELLWIDYNPLMDEFMPRRMWPVSKIKMATKQLHQLYQIVSVETEGEHLFHVHSPKGERDKTFLQWEYIIHHINQQEPFHLDDILSADTRSMDWKFNEKIRNIDPECWIEEENIKRRGWLRMSDDIRYWWKVAKSKISGKKVTQEKSRESKERLESIKEPSSSTSSQPESSDPEPTMQDDLTKLVLKEVEDPKENINLLRSEEQDLRERIIEVQNGQIVRPRSNLRLIYDNDYTTTWRLSGWWEMISL